MILLVTASSRAEECAAAIEQKTHHKAQIARSVNQAISLLQYHDYDLLVLDESFQQLEIGTESLVANHAGMAVMIYVNLSLHGTERVAQEVNRGLQRLLSEKLSCRRAAESLLRNELRGEITSILLNCELALRDTQLSPRVSQKLRVMHDLAQSMRSKLEGNATAQLAASMKPPVAKSAEAMRSR
jgi:hypothetical protein